MKPNRNKKQFTEFRRAFKKWRAKWFKEAGAFSIDKDKIILWRYNFYVDRWSEITEYIAPGYETYMAYQFRGLNIKKK